MATYGGEYISFRSMLLQKGLSVAYGYSFVCSSLDTSGNIGTASGKPSIYDPAVYWGHHEAEWGMSWCASFGIKFWNGYRELIPQDPGFSDRKPLYDAYHQLNHYNLFGGGYLGSAQNLLQQVKKKLDAKEKK